MFLTVLKQYEKESNEQQTETVKDICPDVKCDTCQTSTEHYQGLPGTTNKNRQYIDGKAKTNHSCAGVLISPFKTT